MNRLYREMTPTSFFLLILCCLVTGCDSDDDGILEEKKTPYEGISDKLVWSKKTIVDEDGKKYLKLIINNEILKVPMEYVGTNSPHSPFFDVIVLWPGVKPTSMSRYLENDEYTTISILFAAVNDRTHSHAFGEGYLILKGQQNHQRISEPTQSPDYPGMERYEHQAGMAYYKVMDNSLTTPTGNPLVAICSGPKQGDDNLTFCSIQMTWSEELTVRYKFRRHLLIQLPEIHQQIVAFIQSFYGE